MKISTAARGRAVWLALAFLAAGARAEERPAMLHTAPAEWKPGQPLRVEGSLVNGSQVERVVIRYRGPGEEYRELPMDLQYGDLYRGTVPGSEMVGPGIEYYIEGITFSGDRVPLFMSAKRPSRVLVLGPAPERTRPAETPPPQPKASPRPRAIPKATPAPAVTPAAGGETPPPAADSSKRSELDEELALYSAEDTVTLATRHEETVTKVPAIASSFNREAIQALGARNVYDVLDVVPGLTVSRDVQGFYRVGVRSQRNDAEVLFLLNGHRLNDFFDGKALANLPVENIERIEVIRGPGSAVYGAGAFLAVVNIVTVADADFSRVAAGGGSFGTLDGHLAGAKQIGELRIWGDGDLLNQDGYKKPIKQDALNLATQQPNQPSGVLRGPLDPSCDTNDRRFFANAGLGISSGTPANGKVGASVRYMNEDRGALLGLFDTCGPGSDLKWQVWLADVSYEHAVGAKGTVRVRGYFDDQWTSRLFQLTPANFVSGSQQFSPNGLEELSRIGARTFGGEATADLAIAENNRLSFGLVADYQRLYEYDYLANYNTDNTYRAGGELERPDGLTYPQENGAGAATKRLTLGAYAQDQWSIIERLTLTLGFRVDAVQLPTVDATTNLFNGQQLVPSVNPRVGVVWNPTDPLVLKVLYGRAFRAPTVQELAENIPSTQFNQGRFEGNPNLIPPVVDTIEAGAELTQPAGEARVRIRANAFFEKLTNPIAAVDDTGNIVPLRNREGVRVYGVEAEARLEASKRAVGWVNASWFQAQDLESLPQFWLLTDTPQARFNAGMSMPLGEYLNVDFVLRAGAGRQNDSRSILEQLRRWNIPAYGVVTAQLRTERLWDHLEILLIAQNALDAQLYDDVPRPDRVPGLLPLAGQSLFGTVRATF